MEFSVVNNTLNFGSHILHVINKLVQIVFNVNLSGLVLDTFIIRLVESDNSLQTILTISTIHLSQDQQGTFKINTNLTFDDHVVSQSDKSSQVVIVQPSKLNNTVLQIIFHLLQDHGLVLVSLSDL